MSKLLAIHPTHPQARLIAQAVDVVRRGGVIVYPTDSCYALGCQIGDKDAALRLRRIRQVDDHHHFTIACRDLSDLAAFARVDNAQYRLLKAATPGAYTFILEASREVPRRLAHPKRRTIGLRVPDHPIAQALLAELGEPLLSTTLLLPEVDDLVVLGKADTRDDGALAVSGKTGAGIDWLITEIAVRLSGRAASAGLLIRERQRIAMQVAVSGLESARDRMGRAQSLPELVAADLRASMRALEVMVGRIDVENLLDEIFSSFCIGK